MLFSSAVYPYVLVRGAFRRGPVTARIRPSHPVSRRFADNLMTSASPVGGGTRDRTRRHIRHQATSSTRFRGDRQAGSNWTARLSADDATEPSGRPSASRVSTRTPLSVSPSSCRTKAIPASRASAVAAQDPGTAQLWVIDRLPSRTGRGPDASARDLRKARRQGWRSGHSCLEKVGMVDGRERRSDAAWLASVDSRAKVLALASRMTLVGALGCRANSLRARRRNERLRNSR